MRGTIRRRAVKKEIKDRLARLRRVHSRFGSRYRRVVEGIAHFKISVDEGLSELDQIPPSFANLDEEFSQLIADLDLLRESIELGSAVIWQMEMRMEFL
ncbi:hypothetical protein CC1G_15496 [Coprinopsis cinerea okayama7|uniref:Uncharacterized protein n=1 Tax=Coprinopsis cinerea (strain Okayama-7 / 130 / ATCC MYA-4618 / FGSC 9003) TaxID=240176 RepID=D6RN41_COPC7|nr:hypothetical protein CC1G_15496 [Coprinopsis cinerea okayama7\|eukprot:XP_002910956.1 hypothetical protein CC1G_15496 [Coprinopsis cinerea okayama7\